MQPKDPLHPRKQHSTEPGYIAERRNPFTAGKVVIYVAAAQDLDVGEKYAVVCDTHGTLVGEPSIPKARLSMKAPDNFCEPCAALMRNAPTCEFHVQYVAVGTRNDAHDYGKVKSLMGYYPVEATSLLDAARQVARKVRGHRGWRNVTQLCVIRAQWRDRNGDWHNLERVRPI